MRLLPVNLDAILVELADLDETLALFDALEADPIEGVTELVPAARALGFGVIGYAPLGRGVLTGRYRASTPPDSRGASPHLRSYVAPYLGEPYVGVVEAVATGLDRKPVEVALAWARDAPGIAAAIVGARTPSQLRGALASEDLVLPTQIRHALDEITAIRMGYPERF